MKALLKLKVWSVKDKMPKLHTWHNSKQMMSKTLIVYWRWTNERNRVFEEISSSFGHLVKDPDGNTHWRVSGVTGSVTVLAWGYIKKYPSRKTK